MKRLVFLIVALVGINALRAQDTIYPYDPQSPFFKDPIFSEFGGDTCWCPGTSTIYIERAYAVKHSLGESQYLVTGIAVPYRFADSCPGYRPIHPQIYDYNLFVQGMIVQIINKDTAHPVIHFTKPVWRYAKETPHVRPYDCRIAFNPPASCINIDTVLDAYSLYFDNPVSVSGDVYIGYLRSLHIPSGENPNARDCTNEGLALRILIPESTSVCMPSYNQALSISWDNSTYLRPHYDGETSPSIVYPFRYNHAFTTFDAELVCPIFAVPDTDSFGCPEVEGFAFAGINAGFPTFIWDTAAGHTLYQFAYGPYDAPLDSLDVEETRNRYIELTRQRLSPDVYYQARLRAKCHHACPVHDTVMWTAWSDPVYFYTGDSMPDTAHHSTDPQEEGIAEHPASLAFTLMPNPARGTVTLTLRELAGTAQVTLHDAAGREVLRLPLEDTSTVLSLSQLPAGLYTVTVSTAQGSATRRLSVE